MNKITKLIIDTAERHNTRVSKVYNSLIEISFQYLLTDTFDEKYKHLNDDFFYFTMFFYQEVQNNPFVDILGQTLFELSNLDKENLGQCFTPCELSDAIRRMRNVETRMNVLGEIGEIGGRWADPTCGSGELALKQLKAFSKSNAKHIDLVINDIDELMVKTAIYQTHVNLLLNCQGKTSTTTAYCSDLISGWRKPESLLAHIQYFEPVGAKQHQKILRMIDLNKRTLAFLEGEEVNEEKAVA
ncbi:hypothetical protein [Vibrio splendidus]|uniref:hypothetical protein n=1 Tax=Vibrio splendidus TaxID=29497 RepID=UPI003D1172B5